MILELHIIHWKYPENIKGCLLQHIQLSACLLGRYDSSPVLWYCVIISVEWSMVNFPWLPQHTWMPTMTFLVLIAKNDMKREIKGQTWCPLTICLSSLSWRVQNFVAIGGAYFKLDYSNVWSNFELYRISFIVTGAWVETRSFKYYMSYSAWHVSLPNTIHLY